MCIHFTWFILRYVNFSSVRQNGYSGEKKKNWSNLDYSPCASCLYEVFCRSLGGGRGGGASTTHPIPFFSVTEATQFLLSLTPDPPQSLARGNDVSLQAYTSSLCNCLSRWLIQIFIISAFFQPLKNKTN